jgi:hypothetical protein
VKDASIRSVAFVSSDRFFPGDPDFEWLQDAVQRALEPQPKRNPDKPRPTATPTPTDPAQPTPTATPTPTVDPGAAVEVEDSCAYDPDGWDQPG